MDINEFEKKVMFYFTDFLCPTYRKTFHEEKISAKLAAFGKEKGFSTVVDESKNVILFKQGTGTYVNADFPLILQAHMDMVCVPESADFSHGITPYFPEFPNRMMGKSTVDATPTSLGADDGIGVAVIMAILDSKDIVHPPIVAIFTVAEEDGMGGACTIKREDIINIAPHLNFEKAKFINLDEERDGVFSVSCAGSVRSVIKIPAKREEQPLPDMVSYQLTLSGFSGGHSGILINEGRGNANILLFETLRRMMYAGIDIAVFALEHCGDASNSIPLGANALIGVSSTQKDKLEKTVAMVEKIIKKRYNDTDPNLEVKVSVKELGDKQAPYTKETLSSLIFIVESLPNGVLTWSTDIEGLVETSSNLGTIQEEDENIVINCMIRSSVDELRERVVADMAKLCKIYAVNFEAKNASPGWKYKPDNPLRDLFLEKYEKLFAKPASAVSIHAGLECGHFASKLGDIDFIACGPTLTDVHSPKETLYTDTVPKLGLLLMEVLENV